MTTLLEAREGLLKVVKDEASLRLINSRLILRTGVNLLEPTPAQQNDPQTVSKVVAALSTMGFELRVREP